MSVALPSGGPTAVIWGVVVSGIGSLAMAASLAEICSAYPVGGSFHLTILCPIIIQFFFIINSERAIFLDSYPCSARLGPKPLVYLWLDNCFRLGGVGCNRRIAGWSINHRVSISRMVSDKLI